MELTEKRLTQISKFKITSADTDMQARIRLGSLVNLLIQSAINSADNLGFGFKELRQQKLFWALCRVTAEIMSPLKWQDECEVETWPKDVDKILYLRDFIIRDKEKNLIAKATSGWMAVDIDSKRPKKLEGIHAELFNSLKNKHAIPKAPCKLDPITDGEKFNFTPGYFDIDLNKHVTATRYIDQMVETFSIDFLNKNYPEKLSINYLKETMPGETVSIKRAETSDKEYAFEGTNTNNNTVAFRGKINF